MVDTPNNAPEEFAETSEHEYQNPHYHDEDLAIVDDDDQGRRTSAAPNEKKSRRPPPRPRYYED